MTIHNNQGRTLDNPRQISARRLAYRIITAHKNGGMANNNALIGLEVIGGGSTLVMFEETWKSCADMFCSWIDSSPNKNDAKKESLLVEEISHNIRDYFTSKLPCGVTWLDESVDQRN